MNSAPRSRQQYLDLGEQAHFDLLHGFHRANVALATKGPSWVEKTYLHDDAAAVAFAMQGWADAYLSQNGFAGRREFENVAALTSCFADLDVYKHPHLAGLDGDDLLDRMQTAHRWLPPPTITVASGRGFYVSWVLRSPLTRELLPRWQAVQNAIVTLLADLGADSVVKDATRVLRIVGTINSKSGATVTAKQTGAPVPFEQLERLILANALPTKPRLVLVANNPDVQREPRAYTTTPAQRRQYVQAYALAFDRMVDYTTIARLRGSPRMQDYRHRLLYCYAISGAWYWSSIPQAEAELAAFAREHFADSARYKARIVQTVLDRMHQGKSGMRGIFNGAEVDRRYRIQNRTIIATLELTTAEQAQLKTIVGKEERDKRRAARRRAAGMVSYADRTEKRLQTILASLDRGLTQAAIAEQLNISQQAVSKLLRQYRQRANGSGSC